MRTRYPLLLALGLAVLMLGVACGDEDEESSGTAPAIDSLVYAPDTLTVGTASVIEATFNFADPEGDVDMFVIEVNPPDGVVVPAIQGATAGTSGLTAGALSLMLALNPPVAGNYDFTITVMDSAGNTSNGLSGTLTAQ